jgi:spermidine synthase
MRRTSLTLVMLLAVAAACRAAPAAEKTLHRRASPFTTIVVGETEEGLRVLRFGDDGVRQSVVKVGDPDRVELPYARAMPVALALVEAPRRVLVVGLGGGTIPSLLHKHYPQMMIDVVDIDPGVVAVAREFFGFRADASLHVYVDDGRRYIEKCKPALYDIIFLDAYGDQNIPYDLATKEFLQAARRATAPDGVVAANIWSNEHNPLHDAMVRTYQEAFDDLYVVHVKNCGNQILLALPRRQRIDRDELARRAARISREKKLRFDLGEYVSSGLQPLDKKDPAARVLLDKDRN